MLPSQLLVARARGGYVLPVYATMKYHELYVADQLIAAFRESLGRKRRDLDQRIEEIEDLAYKIGCDYRFARGLAHILNRRAIFEKPKTPVDPVRARIEVFFESSRELGGFALSPEERSRVLEKVARKLGLSAEELENCLRAVHEEEEVVAGFEGISAEELLRQYNLALTQTLLFKALEVVVDVAASGTEAKILLYNVKKLGLMYTAEPIEWGVRIRIDGPASILRQTERYGTRLAKLLPYVVSTRKWRIFSRVKRRDRVYKFYLDSRHSDLFPRTDLRIEEYDSSVEEDFYKRFKAIGSDWEVVREPEPLVAGKSIFVPDFAFVRDGIKVYLEIMGFWTPDYLERKLKKLRELREVNMIVAVSRELACTRVLSSIPHEVVVFKGRSLATEVYKRLKAYEPPKRKRARREERKELPGEIEEYLRALEVARLSEVLRELSKYGLEFGDVVEILEERSFEIDWRGMDPERIVVRRKSR